MIRGNSMVAKITNEHVEGQILIVKARWIPFSAIEKEFSTKN